MLKDSIFFYDSIISMAVTLIAACPIKYKPIRQNCKFRCGANGVKSFMQNARPDPTYRVQKPYLFLHIAPQYKAQNSRLKLATKEHTPAVLGPLIETLVINCLQLDSLQLSLYSLFVKVRYHRGY